MVDDDEVIVTPGTYTIVSLQVADSIDLHGQASQPRPTINASGSPGIVIGDAAGACRPIRRATVELAAVEQRAGGAGEGRGGRGIAAIGTGGGRCRGGNQRE